MSNDCCVGSRLLPSYSGLWAIVEQGRPTELTKHRQQQLQYSFLQSPLARNMQADQQQEEVPTTLRIRKHIPQEYQKELNLQEYVVAIVHKKQAHKVMQALKKIKTSLDELPHLKRIKKADQMQSNLELLLCREAQQQEKTSILDNLGQLVLRLEVVRVPESAPGTRADYQQWSQYWPINFVQLPIYQEVKHSPRQVSLLEECLKGKDELVVFSQDKLLFGMSGPPCKQRTIDHSVMRLLQAWPQTDSFKSIPLAYYLTKLKLYSRMRVCQMCAMALVHSRLSAIFYDQVENIEEVAGILCSPHLNHKVTIFQLNPI